VEKPMTGNRDQAEKLVKTAGKAGRKLLVGFIERFIQALASERNA